MPFVPPYVRGPQGATGTGGALGYYGAFSDTTQQTASSTTTAYPITFNTTDGSNGVSIVSGSRLTVANAGTYNIQFSIQLENTDVTEADVNIWLRKNGTDVTGSNGFVSVVSSHGGIAGHALPAWNYVLTLSAGDYIEFVWQTNNTLVSIQKYSAGASPTRPTTPSVIATVTQVMYTQLGPTGPTGPAYYPPIATASLTGVASFGPEFVVSATGNVSLTGNYVKSFNGATGTVTYSPPVASASVTGMASFGTDFTVSGAGAVSLNPTAHKTLGTFRQGSGSSSSGTAGTSILSMSPASGNKYIDWQLIVSHTSTTNTAVTITITYSDTTTMTMTTAVTTATTVFANHGGIMRTTAGGAAASSPQLVAGANKDVTKVDVTTASTGTGFRMAIFSGWEVSQ